MNDAVESALITSGIGVVIGVIWKTVNHYRLKSECNQNNELVVSVVDTNTNRNTTPTELNQVALEIRDAITINNA